MFEANLGQHRETLSRKKERKKDRRKEGRTSGDGVPTTQHHQSLRKCKSKPQLNTPHTHLG
jgi:hypothetical protein